MLEWGLVVIRVRGWDGRADQCAVEADHLHNLPRLLAEYDARGLLYYWDAERVCYLKNAPSDRLSTWESFWNRLEPHVNAARRTGQHS
jgi:hypothetical protein